MKAYLSTFSDAAEAKGKPLQPQQCCENYISFPVSDRTFSFGARSTPLNLASLEEQPPHTNIGHPARDVLSFFLIYRSIIDYLFSSL